jgi:hypothetical protein
MNRHCARCEQLGREAWKSEEEFPRDKNHSSGRGRYCKLCNRELAAAWRAGHPGETAAQKQWREDHRDQERQNDRNYYERNRDRVLAGQRARRKRDS